MRPGDVDEVVAIERISFSDPWSPRAFAMEASEGASRSWSWVAEVEGEIVGYLVAWPVEDEVHLANVAVAREWRGRGIGRYLMEKLLERSRRHRASWIALEVRFSNEMARSLYESLGFRPVAIRKNYYRSEMEDALVMMCRLEDLETQGMEDERTCLPGGG
jgi:ribosomal-protein-alanine N-acetyltransferase